MALVDPNFPSLMNSLSGLALEERTRRANLVEHIESLEEELLLLNHSMKSIQIMAEHDEIAAQWLQETADLVSNYKRRLAKKKWVGIPQFLNLNERNELALEIESVTLGLRDCSQKILAEGNIPDSAFKKLIEFLVQNRNLHDELVERLLIVKNKMVPFEKFLQELEAEAVLHEWEKFRVQEIKGIFHLLEQSLLTSQCSMEEEKETKCKESFSILPLMIGSLRRYEKDLMEKIIELERRIDTISISYELYEIGGFKAEIGPSVIISRLPKMQQNEPAVAATSRPESSTSINTLNHENVPPFLLRFLFYFLLFPVGKEIPYRRLSAVWIAEGIVGPKRGEYICRLRLFELIQRKLVVPTRRKHNGHAKAFKLRDTNNYMRETLSRMAEATNFFKDDSNMTSRLAHYDDINTSYYEHIDGSQLCSSYVLKSHYKEVISFFSFDTTEGRKHGENIGNFLHRCIANGCFKLMRVLDLERVFKPKLPSAVGALTGLRYLGLRWTYLERLPDHVSMLLNLQVLDIKRTYISTLPKSIWSMQYLRHLYLSETYRSRFVSRPRNSEPLDDLWTLWGAFIDEDSPVENGLDTILSVRKLGLTCRSMSTSSTEKMESQLMAVARWIKKLEHLEDLRFKSFDDLNKPSDLYLGSLSGHIHLSRVYLVGRLRDPSTVVGFPVNITYMTLSGSELENDPMVALQKLPYLRILRLLAASTKCSKMKCTLGGFPNLQFLKLWGLENWDEWKLEEGALPRLMDLEIRNCHNLKKIPHEIRQIRFLSEFRLSHQFEEEIKKNQPSLWNEIKPVLKVEGKPDSSCLYVKVSMDGAPYLRQVDLKTYFNYAELSAALEKMFSGFTSGKCASDGCPEGEMNNAKGSKDIIPTSEYVLTYEDEDGDWMLVGDGPWEMFVNSCKRLRIKKGSEATELAPSTMQKFQNTT